MTTISPLRFILLLFALLVASNTLLSQERDPDRDHKERNWCVLNCDPEIHTENIGLVYGYLDNDSIMQEALSLPTIHFPIRFAYVVEDVASLEPDMPFLNKVIMDLNHSFRNTGIEFNMSEVVKIQSDIKLEQLSSNAFQLYDHFSNQYDLPDIMTVYVVDYDRDFCRTTETSISCSRVGGFSYVLSGLTSNLVMSQFDLKNPIIVAHEFGHFFGLYHTFEERLFGKGSFDPELCNLTGDLICDTPPDPGTAYEIYVNYATCEMIGHEDRNGNSFEPIINNYMGYYKPCYLQEFIFTPQQEFVVRLASRLQIRKRLSQ